MPTLIDITSATNIPAIYRNSPIYDLIRYQNFDLEAKEVEKAEMLICTCMDYRINLKHPEKFAYTIRNAGANMKGNEFQIAYAIANAGVNYIAVIGHTQCGMRDLQSQKDKFVEIATNKCNWSKLEADNYFKVHSVKHEIGDEVEFVLKERARIQKLFPKIIVAPLLYDVDTHELKVILE